MPKFHSHLKWKPFFCLHLFFSCKWRKNDWFYPDKLFKPEKSLYITLNLSCFCSLIYIDLKLNWLTLSNPNSLLSVLEKIWFCPNICLLGGQLPPLSLACTTISEIFRQIFAELIFLCASRQGKKHLNQLFVVNSRSLKI